MLDSNVRDQLRKVVGTDRCLEKPEELLSYSYDAYHEESIPYLVLLPITCEEVSKIMEICSKYKISVTARGAGTNLCGASIPVNHGIILCFSQMDKILEVNTKDRYIIVQPGVVNVDIQKALVPFNFFYPPDPGSMNSSTIGGNVAQNAGGPRCLKYGVTADYILGMEVVLASGKIVKFGSRNVKDATGYRLSGLVCGSEGTLCIVTEIILRVVPLPETIKTILVTFDDLDNTAKAVSDIIGSGILPVAIELLDKLTINTIEDSANLGLPRQAEGSLLIEIDGVKEACEKEIQRIIEKVQANGATSIEEAKSEEQRDKLWEARRTAFGVFAKLAPDIVLDDVTVPVSKVPSMIRQTVAIVKKYGLKIGILAHAGDGNLHPMIPTDKNNKEEWARVKKAFDEIVEAAVSLNGTLSGEHGIGLAKTHYLPLVMRKDSIDFMSVIKKAVDPDGILNPGKFV